MHVPDSHCSADHSVQAGVQAGSSNPVQADVQAQVLPRVIYETDVEWGGGRDSIFGGRVRTRAVLTERGVVWEHLAGSDGMGAPRWELLGHHREASVVERCLLDELVMSLADRRAGRAEGSLWAVLETRKDRRDAAKSEDDSCF